ncbi:MAG: DUF6249 domain-containing protein [Mediterranea sp.]|jgi:hypothetical protein|nr:DUF6249 domain-containing protein [Mediterranea sp.]
MKNVIIAFVVALVTCATPTLAQRQAPTTVDTAAMTTAVDTATANGTVQTAVDDWDSFGRSFSSGWDSLEDNDSKMEYHVAIIATICVFAFPVLMLIVIFYFRNKNRQARYRVIEQALATGQPIPKEFYVGHKPSDQRSSGIMNICIGLGLFIFLWTVTGAFGIGAIGLIVFFTGLGQWIVGRNAAEEQRRLEEHRLQDEEDGRQ